MDRMTPRPKLRVGLLVNPIAGMGGRVGLKGTDGPDAVRRAIALGAEPVAPLRAAVFRAAIEGHTAGGGAVDLVEIVPESAQGTRDCAARFLGDGVDLLLFVGGDGTARDVYSAVGTAIPVLGVPAGVKMHSAVFATSPATAARTVIDWLGAQARRTRAGEVVDVDEAAISAGRIAVRLHGALLIPDAPGRVQGLKASGVRAPEMELASMAAAAAGRLTNGTIAVLGPGTSTVAVADQMGIAGTLLGVDVVAITPAGPRMVAPDTGEEGILASITTPATAGAPVVVIVSPTGGQGFLLGRGNQQLSARVLRTIGLDRLIVVATPSKVAALRGRPLLVDTGDAELDTRLAGYRRVITGVGHEAVMRVVAG
jgi:predicted polyphosphate/ATP-dependent NAD kinase